MKMIKSKFFKFVSLIGALTFFSVNLSACAKGEFDDFIAEYNISTKVSFFFNSACNINFYYDKTKDGERGKAFLALNSAENFIREVEKNLSCEKQDGDVYRFNHAAPGEMIAVDQMTYDVILKTQELYALTDGAFNPAVYPLVDLWGFSARVLNDSPSAPAEKKPYDRANPEIELPAEEYITAFTQLTNYEDIIASKSENGKEYFLTKPETSVEVGGVEYSMQIDLGGYGKGYAADGVKEILGQAGFDYGYASIGSSSLHLLKCPQTYTINNTKYDWQINLTYPDKEKQQNNQWYLKIFGQDLGISTSGDYERFYDIDGVRYCHLIDGKTGYPITSGTASVSIAGGSAAENDAFTTALSVMTQQKALAFAQEHLYDRQIILLSHTQENNKFLLHTNLSEEQYLFKTAYENDFTVLGWGDLATEK